MTDIEQIRRDMLANAVLKVLEKENATIGEMRYVFGMLLHDTGGFDENKRVSNYSAEGIANRCEKHKYSYRRFCLFCFCKYLGVPTDFAHYKHESKLLDQFLSEHPTGRLGD